MSDPELVVCLGDVTLDVLVTAPGGLREDDDTDARIAVSVGGQAANVASWVTHLGGRARVLGPRARTPAGRLADELLAARGVEAVGPQVRRTPAVMSLVADGRRSMASDAGDTSWLDSLSPGAWLVAADVLFVSGYALLRAADGEGVLACAAAAHDAGGLVALDLASATMIEEYGAVGFSRLSRALEPDVVFATDAEWACVRGDPPHTLVLKHGAQGASFLTRGTVEDRMPLPATVVDATGAGDALAAGFLLGGPDLAMRAAADCVARIGAQP